MADISYALPSGVLDRLRPAADGQSRALPRWPLLLIALPAAVAVWSGWVGLGTMCGFGIVHPFPGIWDSFKLNTSITLPVGVEAYGAYALAAWLHPGTPPAAKKFAMRSAFGSLGLGMGGQVIYHLLTAAHAHVAPWEVVMLVSCLPVITLGLGTALTHLMRTGHDADTADGTPAEVAALEGDTSPAIEADTAPAAPEDISAALDGILGITPGDAGADSPADATAVTDADSTPAIEAAPPEDTGADTIPGSAADTGTAPKRPRRGPSTADRVARMRTRHPDETPAEIAARLNLSPRTVRRYLSPAPAEVTA